MNRRSSNLLIAIIGVSAASAAAPHDGSPAAGPAQTRPAGGPGPVPAPNAGAATRPTADRPRSTNAESGAVAAVPAGATLAGAVTPALWRSTRPLPDIYAALITRSVFARNGTPAVTGPATKPAGPGGPGGPAGAAFAFRGVGVSDGRFLAFVEDVAAKQIRRCKPGDPIAGGRVVSVTLDKLEYEAAGKVAKIALGHSLAGTPMPPPPPKPASGPATGPAGPGGPGGPGGPPQPGQRGPRPPGGMPPGAMPPGMVVQEGGPQPPNGAAQ